MPDHVHVLAEGAEDGSNLREFMRFFKQSTAFEFKKVQGKRLWEKSYYDRVLRPGDGVEDVACYIWWNPVRKGLCKNPEDFPYSGSQTMDWMKCAAGGTDWIPPWKAQAPT